MRSTTMEQKIRSMIAAKAARDPACIGSHDDFEDDLGLDSLDRLDLLSEVEDEFDVRISEDQFSSIRDLDGLLKAMGVQPRELAA